MPLSYITFASENKRQTITNINIIKEGTKLWQIRNYTLKLSLSM